MANLALRVEGVGKAYRITSAAAPATTLGEACMMRLKRPLRRVRSESFWALRDVSFQVEPGEVVGVIGRNGAGKSTLLKVLSRVTEPTTGKVELWGRVGSLLEVGTGFHPELTGRENIYLNGSILGMRRREIDRVFDQIVDFAGVERFLETPVKRYSSGMYVRLAFAVAAHLSSEILVVDEVLAVGDGEFQKRCLGKMRDVAGSGRTVLFVSHSMQAISALCGQAMFLDAGRIMYSGDVAHATHLYMTSPPAGSGRGEQVRRGGTGEVRITELVADRHTYLSTDDIAIDMEITGYRDAHPRYFVSLEVSNHLGLVVLHLDSRALDTEYRYQSRRRVRWRIREPRLAQGEYTINAYVCQPGGVIDRYELAAQITIAPILPYAASRGNCVEHAIVYPDFSVEEMDVASELAASDTGAMATT